MIDNLNEALIIEVNAGSPRLAQLEDCFDKIIESEDHYARYLEEARRLLCLEFRPVIVERISIVKNTNPRDFFGAQVMPSPDYLEEIVAQGLSINEIRRMSSAENCKRCVIEIDELMITECKLTSRELMAVVLHEMGHTISDYKLRVPRILFLDIATITAAGMKAGDLISKGSTKHGIYTALGGIFVAALLNLYNHGMGYWKNLSKEREADSVAVKCGYGVELANALDKMIATNATLSNKKDDNLGKSKAMIKWGFMTLAHMRQRQAAVLRLLKAELKDEKSPTAREILIKQIAALEEKQSERKVFSFSKNVGKTMSEDATLNESIRSFIEVHSKGMSMLEIDEIAIEIGRIETSEDKLYLVQRVHRNLMIANKAMQKLKRSNREADHIRAEMMADYVNELKALIPKIKAVKTELNPFSVVVKYPKGDYEEGGEV